MTSNEVSNKDDGSDVVVVEEENRDDCRAKAVLLEVLLAFCKVRRAVLDKTAKDDDDEGNEQATKNMIAAFVAVFMKDIYIYRRELQQGTTRGEGAREEREREKEDRREVMASTSATTGLMGSTGWMDGWTAPRCGAPQPGFDSVSPKNSFFVSSQDRHDVRMQELVLVG